MCMDEGRIPHTMDIGPTAPGLHGRVPKGPDRKFFPGSPTRSPDARDPDLSAGLQSLAAASGMLWARTAKKKRRRARRSRVQQVGKPPSPSPSRRRSASPMDDVPSSPQRPTGSAVPTVSVAKDAHAAQVPADPPRHLPPVLEQPEPQSSLWEPEPAQDLRPVQDPAPLEREEPKPEPAPEPEPERKAKAKAEAAGQLAPVQPQRQAKIPEPQPAKEHQPRPQLAVGDLRVQPKKTASRKPAPSRKAKSPAPLNATPAAPRPAGPPAPKPKPKPEPVSEPVSEPEREVDVGEPKQITVKQARPLGAEFGADFVAQSPDGITPSRRSCETEGCRALPTWGLRGTSGWRNSRWCEGCAKRQPTAVPTHPFADGWNWKKEEHGENPDPNSLFREHWHWLWEGKLGKPFEGMAKFVDFETSTEALARAVHGEWPFNGWTPINSAPKPADALPEVKDTRPTFVSEPHLCQPARGREHAIGCVIAACKGECLMIGDVQQPALNPEPKPGRLGAWSLGSKGAKAGSKKAAKASSSGRPATTDLSALHSYGSDEGRQEREAFHAEQRRGADKRYQLQRKREKVK